MSKFINDKGEHAQVPVHPGMQGHYSHSSDRSHIGEHNNVHGYTGGKPPKPKHGHGVTPVNGGMVTRSKSGHVTNNGHHASYLDAMSGQVVPVNDMGAVAKFGGGNDGIKPGRHPMDPVGGKIEGKKLSPVKVSWDDGKCGPNGMRSRVNQHSAALGQQILAEAYAASSPDDQMVGRQIGRLPSVTTEE